MRPLQISPETAIALSKQLGVPLEHLMHMPQHILLQKIADLSKKQEPSNEEKDSTSQVTDDEPSSRKEGP